MSTSYRISVGYPSGFSGPTGDEAEEILRAFVAELQADPSRIKAEVLRLEPDYRSEALDEYSECYRLPMKDLTLKECENEGDVYWWQCASGGSESRCIKESFRRAFCTPEATMSENPEELARPNILVESP